VLIAPQLGGFRSLLPFIITKEKKLENNFLKLKYCDIL